MSDGDFSGLMKVAWGATTVGDVINAMNADMTANAFQRRQAIDEINRRGISVNTPASRLLHLLGGGVAGNFVARYLGAGGVLRTVGTLVGAAIGNSVYNRRHPNPNVVNGYTIHAY